jgi:signal recognition particle subunit SEC65
MDVPGVVYVLIFKNKVKPDDKNPIRDFENRREHGFRRFPIITKTLCIELPLFNKIISIPDVLKKLNYEMTKTTEENAYSREGAYPCDKCKYVGENASQLSNHKTKKHSEKTYTCEIDKCGKVFTRSDVWQKHMRTVHKVELPKKGTNSQADVSEQLEKLDLEK